MNLEQILAQLHALANPANVAGMARYGINLHGTLGIDIPTLRKIARQIGVDHALALQLWDTGLHEGRILGSFIADPAQVSPEQLENWVAQFDSWDVCDQVVELFAKTPFAYQKVVEWSTRPEEFVRRAAFALIAELAAHDKHASEDAHPQHGLGQFFPLIVQSATDERNTVKKAVNWALRNLGKRSLALNAQAIETAQALCQSTNRTARWIGKDALRELTHEKVQTRLRKKATRIGGQDG